MVPIVEPSSEGKDKRKGKTLSWREAKLSLAHAQGSCTPVYAGSIEGGVEEAGRQLLSCAVRAGFGANSRVHAVGDGAPWIVGQIEQQFGDQGRYLIDFYHVCEYLAAASAAIAPDPVARHAWMEDAEGGAQRRASRRRPAGARRKVGFIPVGSLDLASRSEPFSPSFCMRFTAMLSPGLGRRTADRLRRDRQRPSLRRPATPEAARRLVARRACRIHARLADKPNQRRLGRQRITFAHAQAMYEAGRDLHRFESHPRNSSYAAAPSGGSSALGA